MCGRYVQVQTPESLAEAFQAELEEELRPNYNVAPTTKVGTVLTRDEVRVLTGGRWGFLPKWAKTLKQRPQPINARSDKLTGRMYAGAFRKHRVVLPATGFYEWKKHDDGSKTPYFIHQADGEPLAFAGIASWWRDPTQEDPPALLTVAIVTTDAGEQMTPVHDRQPVMLAGPDEIAAWLDVADLGPDDVIDLTRLPDRVPLKMHVVGPEVGNVRNNYPELVDPVEA